MTELHLSTDSPLGGRRVEAFVVLKPIDLSGFLLNIAFRISKAF
jgi:hypothetical protein